jgi:hypothetical protein
MSAVVYIYIRGESRRRGGFNIPVESPRNGIVDARTRSEFKKYKNCNRTRTYCEESKSKNACAILQICVSDYKVWLSARLNIARNGSLSN